MIILTDFGFSSFDSGKIRISEIPKNCEFLAVVRQAFSFTAGRSQKTARRVLPLVVRAVFVVVISAILVVSVIINILASFSARIMIVPPIKWATHL